MKTLFLLLLAGVSYANGPKYMFSDPKLNDELDNIYHDIRFGGSVSDPLTIGSIVVSTITVSSATITNLTVTNLVGGGTLLRSSQTSTTTDFTTTSATPVIITGMSITLTPVTISSRFKLTFSGLIWGSAAGNDLVLRYYANGASIAAPYYQPGAITGRDGFSSSYIYAPGSTSPQTFDVRLSVSAGATARVGDGTIRSFIVEEISL